MYKGTIISATPILANVDIQFGAVLNTNSNTDYCGSLIKIKTSGLYDVDSTIVVTNVPVGNITLQMYDNGVPIPEATVTATSSALTDVLVLPLHDVLKVVTESGAKVVGLSFRLSVGATINNALVTVGRIK